MTNETAGGPRMWATCWTSAGPASPALADPRSPVNFRARVETAARIGYVGLGFIHDDLVVAEERYGLPTMKQMLDDNGLACEIEMLSGWWATGRQRELSDRTRLDMLRMAETLHPRELKIGPDEDDRPFEMAHWQEEFATLCGQAADVGTRVGIEFLPWTNIKDLATARELVEGAGHPGGGLVVDVWHTERFGTPASDLAEIPAERIIAVELSDAAAGIEGDLVHDTQCNRRFCGEGSFDLTGDVQALHRAGWRGPWGVEILSDRYREMPVQTGMMRAYCTAQLVVASALG
ncbi:Xylose isomerase-like TIM barrel [Acidipropionibacterium jensenii]|uniref:Xylose isomerase-like TIM barrel n=1 Tax=Acidipropionibacterium jensenii TaxID=1749 RepID=A0A3S4YNL3_9ACTN|nr:sugar phosphate isomerase/epimerase [Acidipropionibacterium jensenii]VEI02899.1 Xylose isomerase-like TIM barrel [Acidipropionibacterium jensenii]